MSPESIEKAAVLDRDRDRRYALSRVWDGTLGLVMFIGINPSTADETEDDMTVIKCIGFARRWGFGGILMGNLFSYRAPTPDVLLGGENAGKTPDPVNDEHLGRMAAEAQLIVAAWGVPKKWWLPRITGISELGELHCIGRTKDGHPLHPSRTGYTDAPILWRPAPRPEPVGHPDDICADCQHMRRYHVKFFPDSDRGTCIVSSFIRGGTGHKVNHPDSSVCGCPAFRPSGRRFAVNPDPEQARRIRAGAKPDYIDV